MERNLFEEVLGIINESAGDVGLFKALIFQIDKTTVKEYDKYYVGSINAYVFIWSYIYNTVTNQEVSSTPNHRDVRNKLPDKIKKGEQYDLTFDIDNTGTKYVHDRYGTPENIRNYVLSQFQKGVTNYR